MTAAESLIATFRAAFAALDELRDPSAQAEIAAACAAHLKSSQPMALVHMPPMDPVAAIERVLADGSTYRLAHEAGCATLVLTDHEGTTAVSTLTAVEAIRFRADVAAAAGGKDRG